MHEMVTLQRTGNLTFISTSVWLYAESFALPVAVKWNATKPPSSPKMIRMMILGGHEIRHGAFNFLRGNDFVRRLETFNGLLDQ